MNNSLSHIHSICELLQLNSKILTAPTPNSSSWRKEKLLSSKWGRDVTLMVNASRCCGEAWLLCWKLLWRGICVECAFFHSKPVLKLFQLESGKKFMLRPIMSVLFWYCRAFIQPSFIQVVLGWAQGMLLNWNFQANARF